MIHKGHGPFGRFRVPEFSSGDRDWSPRSRSVIALYSSMRSRANNIHLQNSTGKVLIIIDAAIALTPLCHEVTVEPRIRHGALGHGFGAKAVNVVVSILFGHVGTVLKPP